MTYTARYNAAGERMASIKQANFIADLLDRKNLFASNKHMDECGAMDSDEYGRYIESMKQRAMSDLTVSQASEWIDRLLDLPDKETERGHSQQNGKGQIETTVPAGHYAVTGEDGTTDFYRVDRPDKGKWAGYTFVKLQLSDDYQNMPRRQAESVLRKIEQAGPREAAIRYGHELGRCSVCNRTLTNPDSIAAGIGPVCAGRHGWEV